jgi:hypothetical protein
LKGFSSIIDLNSLCIRRCFWDVVCLPAERERGIMTEPAQVKATLIKDDDSIGNISLGIIIGKVTHKSATVLVEVSGCDSLELICRDQITGTEYACVRYSHYPSECCSEVVSDISIFSRTNRSNKPSVFVFDQLVENRPYDILAFGSSSNYRELRSNHEEVPGRSDWNHKEDYYLYRASFTTLRKQELKTIAPYSNSSISMPATDLNNTANIYSNNNGDINNSQPSKVMTPNALPMLSFQLPKIIMVLGPYLPQLSHICDDTKMGVSNRSRKAVLIDSAHERNQIIKGIEYCHAIADFNSQSWVSPQVVLHLGSGIDISGVLNTVVSHLVKAEHLSERGLQKGTKASVKHSSNCRQVFMNNGYDASQIFHSYNVNVNYSEFNLKSKTPNELITGQNLDDQVKYYLYSAFEELKNSYRLQWGSTVMKDILSYSSHIFVSCPALDLLRAFHAQSWRELSCELSPFCVNNLLAMMTALDYEYQKNLSALTTDLTTPMPTIDDLEKHIASVLSNSVHYVAAGAVAIFTLLPNFSYHHDYMNETGEGLISEFQLLALERLLSNIGEYHSTVRALIVASPIPILAPNSVDSSSDSRKYSNNIQYGTAEVVRLLDLLVTWLEGDDGNQHFGNLYHPTIDREVAIVTGCGLDGLGFNSYIKFNDINELLMRFNVPIADLNVSNCKDSNQDVDNSSRKVSNADGFSPSRKISALDPLSPSRKGSKSPRKDSSAPQSARSEQAHIISNKARELMQEADNSQKHYRKTSKQEGDSPLTLEERSEAGNVDY